MNKEAGIATYNVSRGGYDYYGQHGRPGRMDAIVSGVRALDASFAGLVDTARWSEQFTPEELGRLFGVPYAKSVSIEDRTSPEDHLVGLTALSSEPIYSDTIRIFDRNALVSQVQIGGATVDIATVYLHFPVEGSNDIRLREMESLLSQLGTDNTQLVMGDFNSINPDENRLIRTAADFLIRRFPSLVPHVVKHQADFLNPQPIELLMAAGFTDCEDGRKKLATFPTGLVGWKVQNLFRLDKGFIRGKAIEVLGVRVADGVIYQSASDHLPKIFTVRQR